ncbi:MAG TPA: gliding motility-associated C-terminal domain-containing protein, partial [Bacteroidales bacterium]
INIYSQITKNISPVICQGDTCTVGTSKYTKAGIYTDVLSTASGCDSIVTTNLVVNPVKLMVQNPPICEGETFTVGIHSYTKTGTYIDTLTSLVYGCDSIITTLLTVNPNVQTLPLIKSICEGETFTVGTHDYSKAGNYIDVLKTSLGCDSTVTTNLTVNPLPLVSLGDDQLLCPGDSIILTPGNAFKSYLWSDGSVLSNLKVTISGNYAVNVFDGLCSASDDIVIDECDPELWVPNAFTPDNNDLNDCFKPVSPGIIKSYQIFIFNRWGQQLYESNDAYAGWDGTFKREPCPGGVYTYIIEYSTGTDTATFKQRVKRGTVMLLR